MLADENCGLPSMTGYALAKLTCFAAISLCAALQLASTGYAVEPPGKDSASQAAAPSNTKKRVLHINSYRRGHSWGEDIIVGINSVLGDEPGFTMSVEHLDVKEYFSEDNSYFDMLRDLYEFKYKNSPPDLILISDDGAFRFIQRYYDSLFPGTPLVFCGVNDFELSMIEGRTTFTGVRQSFDHRHNINLMLRLHPETDRIVVITDQTTTGRINRTWLAEIAEETRDRVDFVFLDESLKLSFDDLVEKLAALDEASIVYYCNFDIEGSGKRLEPRISIPILTEKCPRPVYTPVDVHVGSGTVGGQVYSGLEQGKAGALLAREVLRGRSPADIPVVMESPNKYVFDFASLKRFAIPHSALPEDSTIINVPDTFYYRYKRLVWTTAFFFLLQSALIVLLTMNIRRRKRAELELIQHREHLKDLVEARTGALTDAKNAAEQTLAELRSTQDQLVQSEKLAVLGRIAAGVAHELNTPLGAIGATAGMIRNSYLGVLERTDELARWLEEDSGAGIANLLKTSLDAKPLTLSTRERRELKNRLTEDLAKLSVADPRGLADLFIELNLHDSYRPYLKSLSTGESHPRTGLLRSLSNVGRGAHVIEIAAQKAARIVQALQSYRKQTPEESVAPVDVRDEIETVLTLYCNQFKKNVQIVREYEDVPLVDGYRGELGQVWTNLLLNSLQAMDYKGRLVIGVHHDGDQVVVSFGDNGCGIPETMQHQVFEPFFTTKDEGEGCGLGLDIVRGIVKRHDGSIDFETTPGEGTTFAVRLPIRRRTSN